MVRRAIYSVIKSIISMERNISKGRWQCACNLNASGSIYPKVAVDERLVTGQGPVGMVNPKRARMLTDLKYQGIPLDIFYRERTNEFIPFPLYRVYLFFYYI